MATHFIRGRGTMLIIGAICQEIFQTKVKTALTSQCNTSVFYKHASRTCFFIFLVNRVSAQEHVINKSKRHVSFVEVCGAARNRCITTETSPLFPCLPQSASLKCPKLCYFKVQ